MKIVLATRNRDKVREITDMLGGLDVELESLDQFTALPPTVEDGDTLTANAMKKAREVRDFTGMSALADDTGLEVDGLDGAPGVFAARYAGEGATYEDNWKKLLADMEAIPAGNRTACFRTVMALALAPSDAARIAAHFRRRLGAARNGTVEYLVSEGMLPGEIAPSPRGGGGFGYDPVFVDAQSQRTLAEMTMEEKNSTSHRYRALIEMRELLLRHELALEL